MSASGKDQISGTSSKISRPSPGPTEWIRVSVVYGPPDVEKNRIKTSPNVPRLRRSCCGFIPLARKAQALLKISQFVRLSSSECFERRRAWTCATHRRGGAACFPNFFNNRSNVSRSLFERTLTAVSIAAACSRNPRVISALPFAVNSTWRTRRSAG